MSGRQPITPIRLDPERRAAYAAAAQASGMTLSGWLKAVADLAAERRVDPVQLRADLTAIRREAAAIGNNLNQLARASNAGQPVDQTQLERGIEEVAAIRRRLNAVLR